MLKLHDFFYKNCNFFIFVLQCIKKKMFGQYLNWTARIQKELSLIITGDIRSKTNTLPISNTEC